MFFDDQPIELLNIVGFLAFLAYFSFSLLLFFGTDYRKLISKP